MGEIVVNGAKLMCPFGTMTPTLTVTSQAKCLVAGKPAATIQDCKPNVNIPNFGMCSSLANPAVASATAAALGVLTPQPCTMVPAGPWMSMKPNVMMAGKPCVCTGSTLICAMGMGNISIVSPGETKVTT